MSDLQETIDSRVQEITAKQCQESQVWPISSGVFGAQAAVVPYPVAGLDTTDFLITFKKPILSMAYYSLAGTLPNVVAFSPTPCGIGLSRAAASTNSNGVLTQFDANFLYVFDVPVSQLYISIKGFNVGGVITIVGYNGMKAVYTT
jgi:hypothetical protein